MIEIVNIEKTAYDKFVGQFEGFVKKMTEMGNRGTNKCTTWDSFVKGVSVFNVSRTSLSQT